MKKTEAKEPKALLEARHWKAGVSREIERKGWKKFRHDAHEAAEKWLHDVATLRRSRIAKA